MILPFLSKLSDGIKFCGDVNLSLCGTSGTVAERKELKEIIHKQKYVNKAILKLYDLVFFFKLIFVFETFNLVSISRL